MNSPNSDSGGCESADAGLGHAWYTVGLLMTAYVLSMLDRTILSLMIEPIQRDLGISDTQFGLLTGMAFMIFYSIAALPIGWLVDRSSRRNIIIVGLTLWSAMTMLSGMASTYMHLFLARIGVGIGEATLSPSAYSLIADLFPKDKLAKAVSVFSIGGTLGMGVAFLLGGTLVSALSNQPDISLPLIGSLRLWQLVFLVAGAPGLLLALLMLTATEAPRPIMRSASDSSGAALLAYLRLRRRVLSLQVCAYCFLTLVTYAFMTWMPALLLRNYHVEARMVGVALGIAAGVFGLLGFLAGGALADHWVRQGHDDAHLRVGSVGSLAAIPLAIATALAGNALMAAICLCGLMFMLTLPTAAGLAGLQLITPPLLRGRISAIFMVIVNFVGLGFGSLSVALFTDYVFADKGAVHLSLLAVTIIFMPVSVLAFGFGRKPFAAAARAV